MVIRTEDLLENVRALRTSIVDEVARLADPAGALGVEHVEPNPQADEQALARDMQAVATDLRIAFDKLRAEVDERR
jgi:hypothetical protein